MNKKLVVLVGGVGAIHLAAAGLLLTGGCTQEDPPMPPGIYVPKQNQNQYPENNQLPPEQQPGVYPESTVPATEPEPAPAPAPAPEVKPAKKSGAKASEKAAASDKRYVVVKGDSLWKIAHKNGLKIEELASYNSLKADAKLKIGQVIYIPAAGTKGVKAKPAKKSGAKAAAQKNAGKGKASAKKSSAKSAKKSVPADGIHVVKSGENFTTIARQYGLKLSDIIHANPGVESNRLKIGQKIRLNENAAPAEIRKAPAKKAAKKQANPAAAAPAETEQSAGGETAAPAQENQTEQPPSKATKNEMDDLLKTDNPASEQESDPKALVPDKDQTIINDNGDAEITINSDTSVLAFCRKFGVREDEVRRLNPTLAGTSRIKAGSKILLSGGGEI